MRLLWEESENDLTEPSFFCKLARIWFGKVFLDLKVLRRGKIHPL